MKVEVKGATVVIEKEASSIHLDIYSDVICPWCYVGKARLDDALKTIGSRLDIETTWKPFQLNPSMALQGMDRKEYIMKKFGSADMSGMQQRLSSAGAEHGIKFAFEAMQIVPNTFNAHRLLWFAKSQNKQHQLAEILFRKYFSDGEDVGDSEALINAAKESGLDEESVRKFLASDAASEEVRQEERHGRMLGINAVPTFVLNGEIIASGAIPHEELIAAVEAVALARTK